MDAKMSTPKTGNNSFVRIFCTRIKKPPDSSYFTFNKSNSFLKKCIMFNKSISALKGKKNQVNRLTRALTTAFSTGAGRDHHHQQKELVQMGFPQPLSERQPECHSRQGRQKPTAMSGIIPAPQCEDPRLVL
jgi:hypothetical protein